MHIYIIIRLNMSRVFFELVWARISEIQGFLINIELLEKKRHD